MDQKTCVECGSAFFRQARLCPGRTAQPVTITQWRAKRFCSRKCSSENRRNQFGSDADRFWARVQKGTADECWPWAKHCNRYGYGTLWSRSGERLLAHRFAYTLAKGEITTGLFVCHTCDNPRCCNPAHLWLGTPKDNNDDKIRKGRGGHLVGEQISNSKLTTEVVLKIFRSTEPAAKAAAAYGVSAWTVYDIRAKRRWAHLHDGGTQ
jgi:hypothetical protein